MNFIGLPLEPLTPTQRTGCGDGNDTLEAATEVLEGDTLAASEGLEEDTLAATEGSEDNTLAATDGSEDDTLAAVPEASEDTLAAVSEDWDDTLATAAAMDKLRRIGEPFILTDFFVLMRRGACVFI